MPSTNANILGPLPRVLCALLGLFCAMRAPAAHVQDFVRIRGLEGDKLVGIGLVIGLEGTGDSMKDSMIAGQPYAALLRQAANISATRLDIAKVRSVAIVQVSAEIPYGGARVGDLLDVRVSALGNAKSIVGGELVATFLLTDAVPADRSQWVPFAIASGASIRQDQLPTTGTIQGGARMVQDVVKNPLEGDTISLILDRPYAGYPAADAIAAVINEELSFSGDTGAARVEDFQTIRVRIPGRDLDRANEFIARLLLYTVDPDLLRLPGRVVIDERREVIVVDENVQVRPSAVTAGSLRISMLTPPIEPTPDNPILETKAWVGVGTRDGGQRSVRLRTLLDSLEQLAVPFEAQVAVIEQLKASGALTAQVIRR
jgi:flagellar P-ring protein precursor FlgI